MVSALTGYRCCRRAWPVLAAAAVYASLGADAVAQGSVAADRAALEALYDATGGETTWWYTRNWNTAAPLGEWRRVKTDDAGRVTALELTDNGLTGTIPAELGNLTKLDRLSLADNGLTGPIPESLGSLSSVRWLSLADNGLTGPIPESLGSLSNLENLYLYGNGLTGPIPESLGSLPNLRLLELRGNGLTGPIPEVLGRLPSLSRLGLGGNGLTGPIPESLGSLPNLIWLSLGENGLTGPIPESLGRLPNLFWLDLGRNGLTGPIPESLGRLPNLHWLDLGRNGLTGPIPESLGGLSKLERLFLYGNGLTGPIPESLGNLSNLEYLSLYGNELTGPIPESLGVLPNLRQLDLDRNGLTGPIPESLGGLGSQRDGFPESLGNLSNLEYLYLYGNELTGPIPESLGRLPNLRRLRLNGNELTGPIPDALSGLDLLELLDLAENDLSGPIPDALVGLRYLRYLHLNGNELTGPIPDALSGLDLLELLDLAGNDLSGPLPSWLAQLSLLRWLNIQNTGLCGPSDGAFQEWLATIEDFRGPTCPVSFSVPDRGGRSITSGGTGETLNVGYGGIGAAAGSTAPSGIAIFQFTDSNGVLISEAGVPAAEPVRRGRIFAEVNGPVNTGLAIANPNDVPANISFYFTDTRGTRSGSGVFELGARQHISRFLDQAPFTGSGSVLGTFTFIASVPVAVIALRGFTNESGEFLMTTLPVAPLFAPPSPFSTTPTGTVYFPHFADGNGWATQVILVNPTDRTIKGTVRFLGPGSDTAAVAPVVLTLDDGSTGSTFDYSIGPRSAQRFTTSNPPRGPATGSVRATPERGNAAPAGLVVFSFAPGDKTLSEAGVPALPKGSAFRVYVEASGMPGQAGSIRTGLAIANAEATANTVTLEVTHLDGSPAAPSATLTLPPSGQIARFLDEISALPENFSGVLRVTSTGDVAIVGLRLRVNEKGEIKMTTTPPSNETGPTTAADVFFPHIVDSGGWSTQFILFSGTAGQASSGTLRFIDAFGQPLDLTISKGRVATDRPALVTLYDTTGGPAWTVSRNWKTRAPLYTWIGVKTDIAGIDGRVTTLDLHENGLTGPIPELVGSLSNLEVLDLHENGLTGPIPELVGSLSNLEVLDLHENGLTGPIPELVGSLSNLEVLDLHENGLTGPIPESLGRLSNLRALWLGYNGLTGPIPAELGNLTKLGSLYLAENGLTGPIPESLGRLSDLEWLGLRNNKLTGPIPESVGNLSDLEWLDLSGNDLTGPLPSELTQLRRLRRLNIKNTGLCVPADSAFQEWLRSIDFSGSTCDRGSR